MSSCVMLAHGGGGRLMHDLIETMLVKSFHNPELAAQHDGAMFELGGARLAFTTDSHVVKPLFFPGSDIGALAVYGTVNDLAMCGARPLHLSLGLILEEGLPMDVLERVVTSIAAACQTANVQISTGDTKVVDQGKGDGIYINTAAVGLREHDIALGPSCVRPGDVVLLSGDVGRHGIAVMSAREQFGFKSTIESDCAPVSGVVLALLDAGIDVHCLRDLTRGGLATALIEISRTSDLSIQLVEDAVPVLGQVRTACELLGFDPLYVANEGRFVAIVNPRDAERGLEIMRRHWVAAEATAIGVVGETRGAVTLKTCFGTSRIMDMLSGEQLPRIC
jgi:hydrogenase expression/formation protein HypE